MKIQTKHFLLYVVSLILIHGFILSISYYVAFGYDSFLNYLLVPCPLIIVTLVFSLKIQSLLQFVIYLVTTIIVWQISFILHDWMVGRLSDTLWLKDMEGNWTIEILRRCIMPVILVSVGWVTGKLLLKSRLP
jgi:hypothetical protein